MLAEKTGKAFVDADETIIEMAGESIPDIFAHDGEDVFRDWETKALTDLGKKSGLVLATGGGCVTRQRNYPFLHQNSTIVWLRRDLNQLPTEGRPLSQSNKLEDMYRVRQPLYNAFADITIDNNAWPETTVQNILDALEERK